MTTPAGEDRPQLYYFNGGFFDPRVRRILTLAGYDLRLGKPGPQDLIAVWGKSPTSARGETVGEHTGAGVVHVEDAMLRSVGLGRDGDAPMGLTIDHQRPYFDASGPSDLEVLLSTNPLDDAALLTRAHDTIAQIRHLHLSKYNDFDLAADIPAPGYVLVIDQTRGDASVKYGRADANSFREMLVFAQEEHRGQRIVIKTHPETNAGHRAGYFSADDENDVISLLDTPVSPRALLEGAVAVYTVSSSLGFEAILAGHKPIVFGQPYYAGWGLSDDRQPIDRRQRNLTRAQLFAGAAMLYPSWYDPYRDQLCEIEDVTAALSAQARARREDRGGYDAAQISLWKRPALKAFFGGDLRFRPSGRRRLVWASKGDDGLRVEDGFLRSRGLGADLVPPLSLVVDHSGIYYDPTRPSDLETLISGAVDLPGYAVRRAARQRRRIVQLGLSKYNLAGDGPPFDAPGREVLLIPGQVEDDASIRLGCDDVATNAALIAAVRRDFPHAYLIYKPHPDVEAGLRPGAVVADVDLVAEHASPAKLLARVDRVATMTSLIGFEALLRAVPVTTYGTPFYALWGLTDDRGPSPVGCTERRRARPELDQLVHAVLIDYPRYFDPVTKLAAPLEVIIDRLAQQDGLRRQPALRILAKLQGLFASVPFWR